MSDKDEKQSPTEDVESSKTAKKSDEQKDRSDENEDKTNERLVKVEAELNNPMVKESDGSQEEEENGRKSKRTKTVIRVATNAASKLRRGSGKKDPGPDFRKGVDITEHKMSHEDVAKKFNTDLKNGLKSSQVSGIRAKDGANELTPPKKIPEWIKFCKICFEGFSMLLWIGAVLCLVSWGVEYASTDHPTYDNLALAFALIFVVVLSSIFTYYQESKSSKIMESFNKMVPQETKATRDGNKSTIDVKDLVVGDIVWIKNGERVPADILLLEVTALRVDNSSLTGESMPVSKEVKMSSEDPLETTNLAFFSTNIVEGSAKGLVIRTGDRTAVGKIAGLVASTKTEDTPIKKEISHFVCLISCIAWVIGLTFFALSLLIGYDIFDALIFLIGIIVANVPEGLLPTVTLCLTLAAKRMAKRNCLVKNLEAVETLGSTSVICSDKTGTLTQNRMTVAHMWFNGKVVAIDTSEANYGKGFDKNAPGWKELKQCIGLCSNAKFEAGQEGVPINKKIIDGDATEGGFLKMFSNIEGDIVAFRKENQRALEMPFNSTTKYHVSVNWVKDHYVVMKKGAPERILASCKTVFYDGKSVPLDDAMKEKFNEAYEELGGAGERVLGFSDYDLPVEKFPKGFKFKNDPPNFPVDDLRLVGLVSLIDPPKAAVPDAVRKCRSAGIKVIMVTGDHPLTAQAIAKQVGIIKEGNEFIVIAGTELANMSDEELIKVLEKDQDIVFARTTPQQKLIIVSCNQKLGRIVAVTGDGVNDSPALKKADIGIAMGIAGSDVSKQASDMILLDDDFASIVVGVEQGRLIFDNLKKSIVYTLTSKVPECAPFLVFILIGIPLPLGTITILFIDLGTDMVPAISLAYEKAEQDLMKRAPRDPKKDRLVNARLIYESYWLIGVMQAFAGFFIYFVIMAEHGFWPGDLINLRTQWDDRSINDVKDTYGQEWTYAQRKQLEFTCHTAFFLNIVQVQWFDLIISKTRVMSLFQHGMDNHVLHFGLVFETALAAALMYTPYTAVVHLYPLYFEYWVPAVFYGLIIFVFDELRRWDIRRRPKGFCARETYY